MKHKLCVWLATLLALCLCLPFAGCADVSAENEGDSGTTPPHTHTFAAGWSHDEEKHWHAATCGHDTQRSGEAAHTYVNGKCTTCNHEHEEHSFGTYEKTETEHSRTCSVCGKVVTGQHTYENGKCKICDYEHQNHNYGADNTCEVCGAKKKPYTMSEDSKKVYFGEYPQTEVTDENDSDKSLRNSLNMAAGSTPAAGNRGKWTDYGYYIEGAVSEYMWYIDVSHQGSRYRGVYFTSYRPARMTNQSSDSKSYQDDNGYETNTVYWFKYEPIEWRILEQKDGTALLMANIILDGQQYYRTASQSTRTIDGKTVYESNYKESDIRAWLTGTFYETAFDEYAQEFIEITEVDNSGASTDSKSNPYVCENTQDKVFLLSYQEVQNTSYGFWSSPVTYDTARQLKSTDYAKSQGVEASTEKSTLGNGWWWERTPYYHNSNKSYSVFYGGYVGGNFACSLVDYTSVGVVPALWIKL